MDGKVNRLIRLILDPQAHIDEGAAVYTSLFQAAAGAKPQLLYGRRLQQSQPEISQERQHHPGNIPIARAQRPDKQAEDDQTNDQRFVIHLRVSAPAQPQPVSLLQSLCFLIF